LPKEIRFITCDTIDRVYKFSDSVAKEPQFGDIFYVFESRIHFHSGIDKVCIDKNLSFQVDSIICKRKYFYVIESL